MRKFHGWRRQLLRFSLYTIPIAIFLVATSVVSDPAYAKLSGGIGGDDPGSANGMTGVGNGTGSVNCTESSCIETASGKFVGTRILDGTFGVTLNYSDATPIGNGSGGSCYGASGTITLTAATGDTIVLDGVGLLCEVGSASAPTTFHGSYVIESGTGRFSDTTGAGIVLLTTDASGNVYLGLGGAVGSGK